MSYTQPITVKPLFTYPKYSDDDWLDAADTVFIDGYHKAANGSPVVDEDALFVLDTYPGPTYSDVSIPKVGIASDITLTVIDTTDDAIVSASAIAPFTTDPGTYASTFEAEIGHEYIGTWECPSADNSPQESTIGPEYSTYQRMQEVAPGTTPVVPGPAPSADQTVLYCDCYDASGALLDGVEIHVQATDPVTGSGVSYSSTILTGTSGAAIVGNPAVTGRVFILVPRGINIWFYGWRNDSSDRKIPFQGVDAETLDITSHIGGD